MSSPGTGSLLADRYRLVERIAVGGMGQVWRADDVLLGRGVAVKTLKPEYLGDQDFRARFRAEARHAGRLSHSGIASVHDYGESADEAWLVMELVDGESLSAVLHREGALPVDRTLDVVAQTAAALQAAHEGGVVHRDVKPGNLLVRPDGVVKVTDFGIASATDAVPLTRTGHVIGTAYYLSPEQAAGRSGSPASDVYALGVVAYECLAGARPFPGDNPVAVALAHVRSPVPPLPDHVPLPVRVLVERALAKDPADRFADAAELSRQAAGLREALRDGRLHLTPADPALRASGAPGGGDDALERTGLLEVVPMPDADAAAPVAARRLRLPGTGARSSRHLVTAAAVLIALIAVGGALRAASTPTGVEPVLEQVVAPVPTDSGPPSPEAVPRVEVDSATWVGKPAAEARAGLAGLGLVPSLSYDGSGLPVGTVSDVEPAGTLAVGTAVLLHVVPEPAPAPVRVAPAPAPAPVETTVEAPAGPPDKAKGKPPGAGKARGKK